MPWRSPVVNPDKQREEAVDIIASDEKAQEMLRERGVATDIETIRELEHDQQPSPNGGKTRGVGDRFKKLTMPEDDCRDADGVPVIDPETGNQACILRYFPKGKDSYEVYKLEQEER